MTMTQVNLHALVPCRPHQTWHSPLLLQHHPQLSMTPVSAELLRYSSLLANVSFCEKNCISPLIILGSHYGHVDITEIVCGDHTVMSYFVDFATKERSRKKTLLASPFYVTLVFTVHSPVTWWEQLLMVQSIDLNKEIQNADGAALKQSSNVRWLSFVALLSLRCILQPGVTCRPWNKSI